MTNYYEAARTAVEDLLATPAPEKRDQWVQEQTEIAIACALLAIVEQLKIANYRENWLQGHTTEQPEE